MVRKFSLLLLLLFAVSVTEQSCSECPAWQCSRNSSASLKITMAYPNHFCWTSKGKFVPKITDKFNSEGNGISVETRIMDISTILSSGASVPSTAKWFNEAQIDIGTKNKPGTGTYDLWVVDAKWIPVLSEGGGLLDLTDSIADQLWYSQVFLKVREQFIQFRGRVYAAPIDADFLTLFIRKDLLDSLINENNRITQENALGTYADLLSARDKFLPNGAITDDNYGFCFATVEAKKMMRWQILADHVQTRGLSQGFFLNPETLEPMVDNEAFSSAMLIFRQLFDAKKSKEIFNVKTAEGKCPLFLGHTPKTIYFDHHYEMVPLLTPGVSKVLDRSTGKLVKCDDKLCPMASKTVLTKDGESINRAPFLTALFSMVITKPSTSGISEEEFKVAETRKSAALEFINWVEDEQNAPQIPAVAPCFDHWTSNQFSNTSKAGGVNIFFSKFGEPGTEDRKQKENTTEYRMFFEYINRKKKLTQDSLDHENMCLSLRMPMATDFETIFEQTTDRFVAGELTIEEAAQSISLQFSAIREKYSQTLNAPDPLNLINWYRDTLGLEHILPPTVEDDELGIQTWWVFLFAAGLTLVVVPLMIRQIRKHASAISELLFGIAIEIVTGIFAMCFDAGDLITDVLTCINVVRDPTLVHLRTAYLIFTGIAVIVGVLGLFVKALTIFSVVNQTKKIGDTQTTRETVGDVENLTKFGHHKSEHNLEKALIAAQARIFAISREIKINALTLMVFLLEDAPCVFLNLWILIEQLDEPEEELEEGTLLSPKQLILLSLCVGLLMSGIKLTALKSIKHLISEKSMLEKLTGLSSKTTAKKDKKHGLCGVFSKLFKPPGSQEKEDLQRATLCIANSPIRQLKDGHSFGELAEADDTNEKSTLKAVDSGNKAVEHSHSSQENKLTKEDNCLEAGGDVPAKKKRKPRGKGQSSKPGTRPDVAGDSLIKMAMLMDKVDSTGQFGQWQSQQGQDYLWDNFDLSIDHSRHLKKKMDSKAGSGPAGASNQERRQERSSSAGPNDRNLLLEAAPTSSPVAQRHESDISGPPHSALVADDFSHIQQDVTFSVIDDSETDGTSTAAIQQLLESARHTRMNSVQLRTSGLRVPFKSVGSAPHTGFAQSEGAVLGSALNLGAIDLNSRAPFINPGQKSGNFVDSETARLISSMREAKLAAKQVIEKSKSAQIS
mmetsp:Transcript_18334/g.35891  ORF Transcript_18334/g.35891 Transcript_18334/m.35891 type:complete len:1182 (-) Transcript_18334:1419-4964(-)